MGTPFLGSKISLISKSEIRYEGILYTIDTEEATIALSKVRSFGTENRPTDKPIAARDDVYEYIIFRASDIKDLIVDDPPTAPTLTDPAIIKAGSGAAASSSTAPQASSASSIPSAIGSSRPASYSNTLSGPNSTGLNTGPPAAPAFGSSRGSTPTPRAANKSPVDEKRPQPPSGWRSQPNHQHDNNKPWGSRAVGGQLNNGNTNRQNQPYSQRRAPGGPTGSHGGHSGPQLHTQMRPNAPGNYRGQGPSQRGRGPMVQRAQPQPRAPYHNNNQRAPGGQNHHHQNKQVKKPEPLKIDGDYDFEKANAEFQELESKLSKMKVNTDGNETEVKETEANTEPSKVDEKEKKEDEENQFYDKTKSFFDAISCEAIERSKGNVNRMDWRKERKTNVETFGVASSYRRQNGGYRGGRGGYRRYNYNQRNNNQHGQHGHQRGGNPVGDN